VPKDHYSTKLSWAWEGRKKPKNEEAGIATAFWKEIEVTGKSSGRFLDGQVGLQCKYKEEKEKHCGQGQTGVRGEELDLRGH
jgi:hypothetical protein